MQVFSVGGGSVANYQGWAQYADTDDTVTTPSQSLTSGVRTAWTCDGVKTTIARNPVDLVSPMWNVTTNKVIPIRAMDTYAIRFDFHVQDYSGSAPWLKMELDIGGTIGVIAAQTIPLLKAGALQEVLFTTHVFAGSTFVTNGGILYLTYDGGTNCKVFHSDIFIQRTSRDA